MKILLVITIISSLVSSFTYAQEKSPRLDELSSQISAKFTKSDERKCSLSSENLLKTHRNKSVFSEQQHEPTPPSSKEPTPEDPETALASPSLKSTSPIIVITQSPTSPRRQSSPNIQKSSSPRMPGSPLKKSPDSHHPDVFFTTLKNSNGKTPLPNSPKQQK